MKRSYLLSCMAAAAMFVVAGINNVSAMDMGGEHPIHQMDELDRLALSAREAYDLRAIESVRHMKETVEMAISNADMSLQGGANQVNDARRILGDAYHDCQLSKVRFFGPSGMPMPQNFDKEPKLRLIVGARIAQDKFIAKLGELAPQIHQGANIPFAGNPVRVGPTQRPATTLQEYFAGTFSLNGEDYMDNEWENVGAFFMYCEQKRGN